MTRDLLIFFYRGKIQDPDPYRGMSDPDNGYWLDPDNGGTVQLQFTVSVSGPDSETNRKFFHQGYVEK